MKAMCAMCSNNLCAKKVPMFKSLSDNQIIKIIGMTGHKNYKKGETICNEGDKTISLIIINEGKVKLSKFDREGKEQILRILSNGSFFGEYYLLSENEVYNFSAYAITDVKICTLSKIDFDKILKTNPEISLSLLGEISKRLVKTENLVQNLSTNNMDSKVAYVLIELADRDGKKIDDKIKIEMPINREEMAKYAGVTRETMSRRLNNLISEGLISTQGNKVIIINEYEKLKNLI